MLLSMEYEVDLYKRETVIIFDEVQLFPKAREAIKYLVKDGRYDYIETGSLISIKENTKNILIPSEEESISMYPMDFEEFAWALGDNELIEYIHDCYDKKIPLYDSMHKKASFLFKKYLLVGGMPKAVSKYLENNKQFKECDLEKRRILKTYRNDIKIDFIISSGNRINNKIIPIEVKSSKNYTTTSLIKFKEKFKDRISESYIIHPKNLSIREDGITCIPVYMTFCLK